MLDFIKKKAKNYFSQLTNNKLSKFIRVIKHIPKIGEALKMEDFPIHVKKFLEDHGHEIITNLKVFRYPIPQYIETVANVISKGEFSKEREKLGYDNFFHLGLVINNTIMLEKNSILNMVIDHPPASSEFMPVNLHKKITLNELLENTKKTYGSKLFRFDAFRRNCQVFTTQVLKANGLMTEQLRTFINQPLDEVIKKMPELSNIFNKITDAHAQFSTVADELNHI